MMLPYGVMSSLIMTNSNIIKDEKDWDKEPRRVVKTIKQLIKEGYSYRQIAKKLNISKSKVGRLIGTSGTVKSGTADNGTVNGTVNGTAGQESGTDNTSQDKTIGDIFT